MLIKDKKIYLICLCVCVVTMILGIVGINIGKVKMIVGVASFLYIVSIVLGILLGSMRTYMDFIKWVFRKKEYYFFALSIRAFFIFGVLKVFWRVMNVFGGLVFCLMIPAVSSGIAYLKYQDELNKL